MRSLKDVKKHTIMKLIYHKTDDSNQYSPFDSELVVLANGQNLNLVSPYIGLSYFERLIKISKTWRLITDFEEWIISHPNNNGTCRMDN